MSLITVCAPSITSKYGVAGDANVDLCSPPCRPIILIFPTLNIFEKFRRSVKQTWGMQKFATLTITRYLGKTTR